ncbi:MAG: long-chain-fatty-acid--CoA ligase [Candidatus Eremiobacterales bacterium]
MKTPLAVTQCLDRARSIYGASLGVVCGSTRLTYGEVAARVDRLSSGLTALGVKRGDVVACLSFNCHRLLELYYAVPQMGAILLPINIRLTPDDVAFIIEDSGAATVVIDRALVGLFAPVRSRLAHVERIILMGGEAKAQDAIDGDDYEMLVDDGAETFERPALDEDAVAELFYTSGTTSRPKGVMLTHRNLYMHAMSLIAALHPTDADVQLHSIPLFHVNGWGTPHTITFVGGRHVMVPRFDPEVVLATIERERVTQMLLVPTMAVALLNAPSAQTRDLSSMRRIKIGGAAAPPSLIAALDAWLPGCTITCGYGLTETTPVLTCGCVKAGLEGDPTRSVLLRSTAGIPIPGVEVEIIDEIGQPLPHDGVAVGEICARGNSIMAGYWKQPEETARAFEGGWFHTGDVGAIDPNGYLYVVDRKKDIIITGGENVASIEIENALYTHPSVLECAVIAVPDPLWGEVPAALVVRKPNASADEAGLIAHCKSTLAGFKVPKRVRFVETLPKGGTGKILKRQLRDEYVRELTGAT